MGLGGVRDPTPAAATANGAATRRLPCCRFRGWPGSSDAAQRHRSGSTAAARRLRRTRSRHFSAARAARTPLFAHRQAGARRRRENHNSRPRPATVAARLCPSKFRPHNSSSSSSKSDGTRDATPKAASRRCVRALPSRWPGNRLLSSRRYATDRSSRRRLICREPVVDAVFCAGFLPARGAFFAVAISPGRAKVFQKSVFLGQRPGTSHTVAVRTSGPRLGPYPASSIPMTNPMRRTSKCPSCLSKLSAASNGTTFIKEDAVANLGHGAVPPLLAASERSIILGAGTAVSANRWKFARRPLDSYARDEESLAMFFLGPAARVVLEGIGCDRALWFVPPAFPPRESPPNDATPCGNAFPTRHPLCACAVGFSVLVRSPRPCLGTGPPSPKTGDAWAAAPHGLAQWRGPELNGVSREKGSGRSLDARGENVLWKRTDLGGRSTPICMRGKLYTLVRDHPDTDIEGEKVVCLDAATGKTIWENIFNVFLSDVPAPRVGWSSVVGDPETGNVFCDWESAGFSSASMGRRAKRFGNTRCPKSTASSAPFGGRAAFPVVSGNLVYVSSVFVDWGDKARPAQRIIAFDKRNGVPVWYSDTRRCRKTFRTACRSRRWSMAWPCWSSLRATGRFTVFEPAHRKETLVVPCVGPRNSGNAARGEEPRLRGPGRREPRRQHHGRLFRHRRVETRRPG